MLCCLFCNHCPSMHVAHDIAIAVLVVFTAAGDSDSYACKISPADTVDVISVAATSISNAPMRGSNFGPCIELLAPGDGLAGPWGGAGEAGYTVRSGSSVACAVASSIGLLYASAIRNQTYQTVLADMSADDATELLKRLVTMHENSTHLVPHAPPSPACACRSKRAVQEQVHQVVSKFLNADVSITRGVRQRVLNMRRAAEQDDTVVTGDPWSRNQEL